MLNTRIAIFIDGSNFYHKLKELEIKHTSEFNYAGFCRRLAWELTIVYQGYYVGVVKAKAGDLKSQKLRARQLHVFNQLRSSHIAIKGGYLLESNGIYHEKGVDVQLAIDLLIGAYENTYDVAMIISSDTDLIPAIKKIRSLAKQVEYIGFYHQPSLGLQREAGKSYLLLKEELEEFVAKDWGNSSCQNNSNLLE